VSSFDVSAIVRSDFYLSNADVPPGAEIEDSLRRTAEHSGTDALTRLELQP